MPRPRTISDAALLDAARRVFLETGFSASTATIARAAGVSEALLYKRFGNKEALFRACLAMNPDDITGALLAARPDTTALDVHLTGLAQQLLALFRELMPRVMCLHTHPDLSPVAYFRKEGAWMPGRVLEALTEALRAEQARGALDTGIDAVVPARMILGAVHHLVFMEQIRGSRLADGDVEAQLRGVVALVVRGAGCAPAARHMEAA
jgi:AcrR family transcriptional regulator